jgi:hypothetical protein
MIEDGPDQRFGLRPRDEDRRGDPKLQRPELFDPQNIGEGFPIRAALYHRATPLDYIWSNTLLGMGPQLRSVPSLGMAANEFGIE